MFHQFSWEQARGISYLVATILLVFLLGVALGLNRLGVHETNIVMVFILGVLLVSARYGLGPGIYSSIGGVLLFNFFFTRPYYTFVVDDTEYVVTFSVMLAISLFISELLSRIRYQAEQASKRERKTHELYNFSRHLTGTTGPSSIARVAEERLEDLFNHPVVILTSGEHDRLSKASERKNSPELPGTLKDAAYNCIRKEQAMGPGTGLENDLNGIVVPLVVSDEPLGVTVVLTGGDSIPSDQLQMLKTCTTQIALSLERDQLTKETREMLLEVEVERMRSALLSSISHDLRTPLASIAGSAETLYQRELSELSRKAHEKTIYKESNRMLRLVDNLLNMVRIESGNLEVEKEWYPVEDVIGSAMTRMEEALGEREVNISYPKEPVLVPLDGVLIEQVLINLIDNAIKYTPDGSSIEIKAEKAGSQVLIGVSDNGPGINPENKEEIFRKFFREASPSEGSQTGLGLAICKAIVEAHEGKISAANRDGKGALFQFSLPIEGTPPEIPQEMSGGDSGGKIP